MEPKTPVWPVRWVRDYDAVMAVVEPDPDTWLMPCPVCGHRIRAARRLRTGLWVAECQRHGDGDHRTEVYAATEDRAVEDWNRAAGWAENPASDPLPLPLATRDKLGLK